jgi:hypothetical protein
VSCNSEELVSALIGYSGQSRGPQYWKYHPDSQRLASGAIHYRRPHSASAFLANAAFAKRFAQVKYGQIRKVRVVSDRFEDKESGKAAIIAADKVQQANNIVMKFIQ